MPAASNAVATVTIQDQDLLSSVPSNLVQRLNASVIFPAINALQYSGYQSVASTTPVSLAPLATNLPFVYIRNANTSGNNALIVEYAPTGSGVTVVNLLPGGIFLFANSIVPALAPFSTINSLQVAVFFQAPVTMEYCFAF
jgi:hypothetical protein